MGLRGTGKGGDRGRTRGGGMGRTRITLLSQLVVAEADRPRVLTLNACFGIFLSLSVACLPVPPLCKSPS